MIKIITGWSNGGGSTIAFINLTNALNEQGIECVMYGRHEWHLDKCRSNTLENISLEKEDSLIVHFFPTNWAEKPPIDGKLIYSCHEKDISPVRNLNYKIYDKIHYVSRPQMEWHNVNHPSFVLPNVVDNLHKSTCKEDKICGIIGSIDRNKQTHISIQRAIDDGMKKILLFGNISDNNYFNEITTNYFNKLTDKVIQYKGHLDNKQDIYNQITDVYHSSLSETFGLIEKECEMTGINYHGNSATEGNFELKLTNDEIIEKWKKELNL